MSGIPVKNHGKKPQGFLKETKTNLCEITREKMKKITCQGETEQARSKDKKKTENSS